MNNFCRIAIFAYAGFAFVAVIFGAIVNAMGVSYDKGAPLFNLMRALYTVSGFLNPCAVLALLWLVSRKSSDNT
jgi:uncharacterized MAPEG superfamily protein